MTDDRRGKRSLKGIYVEKNEERKKDEKEK